MCGSSYSNKSPNMANLLQDYFVLIVAVKVRLQSLIILAVYSRL